MKTYSISPFELSLVPEIGRDCVSAMCGEGHVEMSCLDGDKLVSITDAARDATDDTAGDISSELLADAEDPTLIFEAASPLGETFLTGFAKCIHETKVHYIRQILPDVLTDETVQQLLK
jgi:hypothetical protein